jgi:predicted Fe-S protein YdhL (DUF1289 family)
MTFDELCEWAAATEAERAELFEYLLWIRFRQMVRREST